MPADDYIREKSRDIDIPDFLKNQQQSSYYNYYPQRQRTVTRTVVKVKPKKKRAVAKLFDQKRNNQQTQRQFKQTNDSSKVLLQAITNLTKTAGLLVAGVVLITATISNFLKGKETGAGSGAYTDDQGYFYDPRTVQHFPETDPKSKIKNKIIDEAKRQGVDPALALAVAEQESQFNQNAKSPVGAIGIFQLMPKTAKGLGVDPYNEDDNIRGGIKYIKQMLSQTNSTEEALAAYNWGIGNLKRKGYQEARKVKETREYVDKITGRLDHWQKEIRQGDQAPVKGLSYSKKDTLTSHDRLASGYNDKYDPNKNYNKEAGTYGTFNNRKITSGVGRRSVDVGSSWHKGLDLAYGYGETVKAFCSGVVIHADWFGAFGRTVIIEDIQGYRHVYGHLSQISVSKKQKVKIDEIIGKAGGSGNGKDNMYAPHLHYGIWKPRGKSDKDYIDPRTYQYPPEGELPTNLNKVKKDTPQEIKSKPIQPKTQKKQETKQQTNNATIVTQNKQKQNNKMVNIGAPNLAKANAQRNSSKNIKKRSI